MNHSPDDHLTELLAKAVDDRLSPAEREELDQRLIDEPEARQAYLDLMVLDSYLELEHRSQAALGDLPIESGAGPVKRIVHRSLAKLARPTPLSIGIAAAVIGVLVTAMAFMVPPFYRAITARRSGNNIPAAQQSVAQLTRTHNAVWGEGQTGTPRGTRFLAGQQLMLLSGMAELQFASGTTALLHGPCEFRIDSAMASSLVTGRVAMTVPPQAQGFAVSTPTAEIVDLGTEFGIDVGEEATDVAVFVGVVTVALRQDGALSAAQRVQAGESVKITAGKIERHDTTSLARPIVRSLPQSIITAVSSSTGNPYRVERSGLREDARAYTDELHQWNGVDESGMPAALLGAEYVRTANLDRDHESFDVQLEISQPAVMYVFWNEKQKPPPWLARDFEKTEMQIGLDAVAGRGWPQQPGMGAGQSVDLRFGIWRRAVSKAGALTLGPTNPRGSAVFGIAFQRLVDQTASPPSE